MEITKGDWKVRENDNGLLSIPIEDGLVISATRPEHQVGLTPEQARLIASAPDSHEALKALQLVCRDVSYTHSELIKAREALAKAEGK